MNLDSNDLLEQLTSGRQPSDEELEDSISRTILRVLRHADSESKLRCDYFGLFDFENFVSHICDQVGSLAPNRLQLTIDQLIALEKIEIRSGRIRALYGHSLRGIIVGEMKWPEAKLLHATYERSLPSIFEHGLRPQSRTWVHLTSDIKYADRILKNHSFDGPPVLLGIDADKLDSFDVTFRQPNSHVWLANHIPSTAIEIVRPNDRSEIDS